MRLAARLFLFVVLSSMGGTFSASAQTPAVPGGLSRPGGVIIRERVEVRPSVSQNAPSSIRSTSEQPYEIYVRGLSSTTRCVFNCTEPVEGSVLVTGIDSAGAPFAMSIPVADLFDVSDPDTSSIRANDDPCIGEPRPGYDPCEHTLTGELRYRGKDSWVYVGPISGDSVRISADGIVPRYINPAYASQESTLFNTTFDIPPGTGSDYYNEVVIFSGAPVGRWWPPVDSLTRGTGTKIQLQVRVGPERPDFEVSVHEMWPDREEPVSVGRWVPGYNYPLPLSYHTRLDFRITGEAAPLLTLRRSDTGESGRELLGVPASALEYYGGVVVAFAGAPPAQARAAPQVRQRVRPDGTYVIRRPDFAEEHPSASSSQPLARDARSARAGAEVAGTYGRPGISGNVLGGLDFAVEVVQSGVPEMTGAGTSEVYPLRLALSLEEAGPPMSPALSGPITARATIEAVHTETALVQAFVQSLSTSDISLRLDLLRGSG